MPTPTETYLAGYLARCRAMHDAASALVDVPTAAGLAPTTDGGHLRLAVVHDDAHDVLRSALDGVRSGTVTVFDAASRCAQLMAARAGWRPEPATAMVHGDLRTARGTGLPAHLHERPVRRTPTDDPSGVPLVDAVALAVADDGDDDRAHVGLAAYLATLPEPTRLIAAVDDSGVVRATSGYAVYGEHAHVFFVNTAAAGRGRGVGTAMTGAALTAARSAGARDAHLDASAAGLGLYVRLGFEVVAATTRFTAHRAVAV